MHKCRTLCCAVWIWAIPSCYPLSSPGSETNIQFAVKYEEADGIERMGPDVDFSAEAKILSNECPQIFVRHEEAFNENKLLQPIMLWEDDSVFHSSNANFLVVRDVWVEKQAVVWLLFLYLVYVTK